MIALAMNSRLRALRNPELAERAQRYFKTGKGEYGEGDRFLGIRVPLLRAQLKQCGVVTLQEIQTLLNSAFHEERLFALLLLVRLYEKGDAQAQAAIYAMYLQNLPSINNWDLVDSSASQIVGRHLAARDKKPLYKLVKSANVWERRIAIIATFYFIRDSQFTDALHLAELLLHDQEDLIHKAVGWMLREIGKRDMVTEQEFLRIHYQKMPRTMLRYAIEKFPQPLRKRYLSGAA